MANRPRATRAARRTGSISPRRVPRTTPAHVHMRTCARSPQHSMMRPCSSMLACTWGTDRTEGVGDGSNTPVDGDRLAQGAHHVRHIRDDHFPRVHRRRRRRESADEARGSHARQARA